jgi:glycosidase
MAVSMLQFVKKYIVLSFILSFHFSQSSAQNQRIFDPPFWYKGLTSNHFHLLIHTQNIQSRFLRTEGGLVKRVDKTALSNPNYLDLFIYLNPNSKDSTFTIILQSIDGSMEEKYTYFIKPRNGRPDLEPINASDNMYLIMPDRFSNGNPENDEIEGLNEGVNHKKTKGRHGGDLAGIINNLDYLQNFGVTALWLNPVLENNQPVESYHGYAFTDHYQVDPRLGSNEIYRNLSDECEKRGVKLIQDVVYNHIGSEHPWYKDIPDTAWFNSTEAFVQSNFRIVVQSDPYASQYDAKKLEEGWFDKHMPDLNQRQRILAAYLVQNTIWWIEYAKLSGIRIDTYGYSNENFMRYLVRSVKAEFPDVFVFGEIWEHGVAAQTWFGDHAFKENYVPKNTVDGITDFQLYFALNKALNENNGWTEGVARLYYTLAADYVYQNPNRMVTFADNHDLDRFFGVVNKDFDKWKQGMGFLLTVRGIPCIYYGSEILFDQKGDHGLLRTKFPGGWPADTIDKFTRQGRTPEENEAFDYLQKLMLYRSENPMVFNGDFKHYVPENNVYVYFRKSKNKNLMVIMNGNDENVSLKLSKFSEDLNASTEGTDIITNKTVSLLNPLDLTQKEMLILEIK